MEDASTSETGSSPLLRYVCTRAQIYGMSHTFVMGSKFKICRTTALRKMLPRSPRLSLRLSEILWLNELAEHSSGHNFETCASLFDIAEWSNHRWDSKTRPASRWGVGTALARNFKEPCVDPFNLKRPPTPYFCLSPLRRLLAHSLSLPPPVLFVIYVPALKAGVEQRRDQA